MALSLCMRGHGSDEGLQKFFGISQTTLYSWQKKHPEFRHHIKRGRHFASCQVDVSILDQATGYTREEQVVIKDGKDLSHIETIEKYYPPTGYMSIYYSKNRNTQDWKDKQEIEHSGNMHIKIVEDEE